LINASKSAERVLKLALRLYLNALFKKKI